MKRSQISLLEPCSTSELGELTGRTSSKSGLEPRAAYDERLFLRLQLYFAPYPEYRLLLGETAPEPIRVLTVTRRGDKIPRQTIVTIERKLFSKETGDWVVPTLLRLVRSVRDSLSNFAELEATDIWMGKLFGLARSFRVPAVPKESSESAQLLLLPGTEEEGKTPALRVLWEELIGQYFPEQPELKDYRVIWSYRRHTSTLASCHSERRVVRVAAIMQHVEALPYLEPLLYHELCHAALGPIKVKNGRRVVHGREFKLLERRHPGIPLLNKWIKSGGWHRLVRHQRRRP